MSDRRRRRRRRRNSDSIFEFPECGAPSAKVKALTSSRVALHSYIIVEGFWRWTRRSEPASARAGAMVWVASGSGFSVLFGGGEKDGEEEEEILSSSPR